ncbi:hypothetical protein [Dietzia sp. PP-33]|jgi:hypothetical protein|uniref:hypothetical protein n=1 Tax=Dietzia sp. PP-33 TaxID=2957500 RepID=UPI0029A648CC|nr:hypothetical protein [Dietzia sp. PP-33]MDX2356185.1 hypothetical protein [Dietzia sp. PP-33]
METDNVTTMAECAPNGQTTASTPTTSFPNKGNSVGIISSYSTLLPLNPESEYTALVPQVNKRVTAWLRPRYRTSLLTWVNGPVYLRATLTSRAYATTGYALSDLYMTIDQYRVSNQEHLGSFTMIFSRSECAVDTPSSSHLPLANEFEPINPPAYPADPAAVPVSVTDAPSPDANGQLPVAFARTTSRGLEADGAVSAELPATITATSPIENSTASETTTSAPPDPSSADESTSAQSDPSSPPETTSAPTSTTVATTTFSPTQTTTVLTETPTTVIPGDPGTLSATAETAKVGTVEVDGTANDVVVKGDTVPTDADTAAAALDTWINDGTRPSGDWTTFTSTDPDSDGWRWAAINQVTGTVVYIR